MAIQEWMLAVLLPLADAKAQKAIIIVSGMGPPS